MNPFCWHKWSRWSEAIPDYDGSLHQVCKCEKCVAIAHRRAVLIMRAQLQAEQVNDAIDGKDKQCGS